MLRHSKRPVVRALLHDHRRCGISSRSTTTTAVASVVARWNDSNSSSGDHHGLTRQSQPQSPSSSQSARFVGGVRCFSSSKQQTTNDTESLEETVRRMQDAKGESEEQPRGDNNESSSNETAWNPNPFLSKAADAWSSFADGVGTTWNELLQSDKRKSINKKIHPVATAEGDLPYTGPVEMTVVIDPSENLTAWERMQKRLADAPIISDIIMRSERLYEESGAKKVKQRVDDIREDAAEAWETSQNPWVYRASSVYDTLTAETAESDAVRELRKLDPEFTLDDWRRDVVEHTLPLIMKWYLEGKINQLKPWCGESVFKRIVAEITARRKEGTQIDTNVLDVMNSEILACEPDEVNKGSPIILLHFMVQQINCVRKKEDHSVIVEGAEDEVRAVSYLAAFQREYSAERGELNWKIVDFRMNGAIAYL